MAEAGAAIAGAGTRRRWRRPSPSCFADRERLAAMGRAALAYAEAQGDQLGAALGLIRPLLPAA